MELNSEKRYMISDASKLVDVESHVLRYWEEELLIEIPRNEMGHRYYTAEHIKLLRNVKELKEQGFQLKAIKMLVPELNQLMADKHPNKEEPPEEEEASKEEIVPSSIQTDRMSKLDQFQKIIGDVVTQALKENNISLSQDVSEKVSDNVIKEIDYLVRIQEEKEEERFKKLDETIRNVQKGRKEVAYTSEEKNKGFFSKKIFHRNKKRMP